MINLIKKIGYWLTPVSYILERHNLHIGKFAYFHPRYIQPGEDIRAGWILKAKKTKKGILVYTSMHTTMPINLVALHGYNKILENDKYRKLSYKKEATYKKGIIYRGIVNLKMPK